MVAIAPYVYQVNATQDRFTDRRKQNKIFGGIRYSVGRETVNLWPGGEAAAALTPPAGFVRCVHVGAGGERTSGRKCLSSARRDRNGSSLRRVCVCVCVVHAEKSREEEVKRGKITIK